MTMIRPRSDVVYGIYRGLPSGLNCQICHMLGGSADGAGSACGAIRHKRFHWQREIESAIALTFVLMYWALKFMLKRSMSSTNFLTKTITSGDLEDFLLIICTTAWLST